MDVKVRHDEENQRFVAEVEGNEVFVEYRWRDDATLDLFRTYTPEALRGRGLAGRVVEAALEHAKAEGLKIVPTCPYVARTVERHDAYRSLLAG